MLPQRKHAPRAKKGSCDHIIDKIADINALVNGLSLLPQVIHAYKSHDLSGISLSTFFITGCAQIIWQLYGWHRRAYPVIISSALIGVSAFIICILVLHSRGFNR
jgi:MtN3 and saliva related transmembrane protein